MKKKVASPSKEVFLVFRGEDGPDCSPSFDSCFDTYEQAQERQIALEEFISKQHMASRPKGSICWHNVHEYGGYCSYRRSFIRFEPKKKGAKPGTYDYGEYPGEVVYIKGTYLNNPKTIV